MFAYCFEIGFYNPFTSVTAKLVNFLPTFYTGIEYRKGFAFCFFSRKKKWSTAS
jgi:hypothetical protein